MIESRSSRITGGSFPDAAFFLLVVKRFPINFVNGGSCNAHVARLSGHEEINIVNRAVGGFHIDAGEIFAAAETGNRIIVDPDQIKREIFASIVDVKLFICGSSAPASDVPFDPSGDVSAADLPYRGALRKWFCLRER